MGKAPPDAQTCGAVKHGAQQSIGVQMTLHDGLHFAFAGQCHSQFRSGQFACCFFQFNTSQISANLNRQSAHPRGGSDQHGQDQPMALR